jgi:glutaredoxin-related protein
MKKLFGSVICSNLASVQKILNKLNLNIQYSTRLDLITPECNNIFFYWKEV